MHEDIKDSDYDFTIGLKMSERYENPGFRYMRLPFKLRATFEIHRIEYIQVFLHVLRNQEFH